MLFAPFEPLLTATNDVHVAFGVGGAEILPASTHEMQMVLAEVQLLAVRALQLGLIA
jgi:hypothetical protein